MESNAWLTHPATQELIFDQDAETLWNTILRKKDWQHRILEQSPEDPSWN
jgi:putative AlgH/UPF0301 family transcriptional regulator